MMSVFLPMIEEEEINPTFAHPPNWNKLSSQEKADILVINNTINLICVADLSSHYFKDIFSLSIEVEQILNKDSRLDINAQKEELPDLNNVLQEIKKTRIRINRHQNNQKDSFKQKTSDDFSLLGPTTNRSSQLLSVKGKPILFKSRARAQCILQW